MERICLQTVNSNCWRRVKFLVLPGYTAWPRLPEKGIPQFANHYLLWCPLHGWLTTQWSSLRPSERLTEKLTCQGRKATPAHCCWTCEVSSFHSAFQFSSTAPGLHTVGRHFGDDRSTHRRKVACPRLPNSYRRGCDFTFSLRISSFRYYQAISHFQPEMLFNEHFGWSILYCTVRSPRFFFI